MTNIVNPADKLAMTTHNQNRAASPELSAWVSANAGSGKTHVLVKRVIRILLAGTLAHKILCLTFTKTAAAEMQNRLFKTLSEWAVMDDERLIKSVFDAAAVTLKPDDLGKARRLFAEALETPGGLKIQTVHAFCERILHTFPIEAGISPQFEVIDDRNAREMLSVIKRDVLNEAQNAEGKFGNIMPVISQYVNEAKFDELLNVLIKNRQKMVKLIGYDFTDIKTEFAPFIYKPLGNLGQQLGIEKWLDAADKKGVDVAEYYADILADDSLWPKQLFVALAEILQEASGATNLKIAASIDLALSVNDKELKIETYFDIFLTKDRKPAVRWISKPVQQDQPEIYEKMLAAQQVAAEQFETLSAVKLYQASTALFEIGNAILWKFVQQKQAKSMVDYDDLINITAKLLNGDGAQNNGQTAWVLYKLDNGLDHILIDEAQDTSPNQWAVIEPLVREITAGEGAHDAPRSLFVVGDEKQSIYKFQGADREEFKRKQIGFKHDFEAAGLAWETIELDLSFRSSKAILNAVDRVFNFAAAASGVYDDNAEQIKNDALKPRHFAHRKVGGIVELWPVETGLEVDVPNAWRAPIDELSPISPSRMLADNIALKIANWISSKRHLKSTNRAVKPSDILILVRRRNDFVNALIRALKKLDIPVAGIDRMRVRNELIVEDMIALGKFCLLPEDELNLAIILKSPFIGIDDEKLFELAHGRTGNLWHSLGQAQTAEWRNIYAKLASWRRLSQQIRPFDFYSQILSANGMRKKLIARLGKDALDPLDEFLNLVENFELNHVADLNHLIKWIESDEEELKREIDQEKDEVRIMTVHGAKGLESNIVILPDTCAAPRKGRGDDLAFADEFAYWRPSKNTEPDLVRQIKAANYIKEIEEYHRLLYVAMTRAGDELYMAGYAKKPATGKEEFFNWYQLVEQAMQGWATEVEIDGQTILRFETDGEKEPVKDAALADVHDVELSQWAFERAPRPKQLLRPQAPSSLLETNWEAADFENMDLTDLVLSPLQTDDKRRFLRGNIIHKLLENLPKLAPELHDAAMQNYLRKFDDDFNAATLAEIGDEVTRIMNDEQFAALFGQNSQSEVSIVGEISLKAQKKLISGQIDRLVIGADEILILDYKSNRPPPKEAKNVALQYLGQMAAYRDLLRQTYPQHSIKTALLWTFTGDLMWLDDEQLDQAYQKIFA
ncbi:MAG: double-strand break repair helicase AddA [Rhizobiales bacterium]|nr:double-strand break repair helicase AddA [Hyphomicrobiales bacterium]NRB14439.1 double-strand break repair helicase AddA [Hyphomicrobiales bacterium]